MLSKVKGKTEISLPPVGLPPTVLYSAPYSFYISITPFRPLVHPRSDISWGYLQKIEFGPNPPDMENTTIGASRVFQSNRRGRKKRGYPFKRHPSMVNAFPLTLPVMVMH